jgi:hypothetical protein
MFLSPPATEETGAMGREIETRQGTVRPRFQDNKNTRKKWTKSSGFEPDQFLKLKVKNKNIF